jgi:GDP-L-galactose phosphorylase
VRISRLADYPVNGFVVELADATWEEMAAVLGGACVRLQGANIPHNLLIADGGARAFLWPQCFAEKQARGEVPEALLETGVNPAVFEISGHMLLKRRSDYEGLDEAAAVALLEAVSLPEARFLQAAELAFGDRL